MLYSELSILSNCICFIFEKDNKVGVFHRPVVLRVLGRDVELFYLGRFSLVAEDLLPFHHADCAVSLSEGHLC